MSTEQFATTEDLAAGDVVCLVSDSTGVTVVSKAVPAIVLLSGFGKGIVSQAATKGGAANIITGGRIPRNITGLSAGVSGPCRISSTGRIERVNAISSSDQFIGWGHADGSFNLYPMPAVDLDPAVAPLTASYATVSNAPGRTGVYTSSLTTYTSTIDAALTTLSAYVKYDNGAAAAAIAAGKKLPVLLLLHGYSQDAGPGYISEALKQRAADAGFVAVAPHQRGRGGNPGTADDCRDLQDIIDAVAMAATTYPTVVDATRVHVLGYSGGGAAAVALATKFPGKCISIVSCFGWGDVGLDPRFDHSYWGSRDARAVVVTRVGGRNDLEKYRARSSLGNIGHAVTQSSGALWLLWDALDPIGRCLRDVRDALVTAGAPTSKWLAVESNVGSFPRWLHGYPETNPDLVNAEPLIYRRRDELAPSIVHSGFYPVRGFVVHGAGFELWTASTGATNAKTDAAGGQKHSVDVVFDVGSQQYRVTPKSGTCVVTIIQGRRQLTKTVSAETAFDLANSLEAIIPDARHVVDLGRGVVLSGSNITSVADQISGSTLVPPAAAIVYDDTDTEYPVAKFVGSGDNLRGDALSLLAGHEDFGIVVRARATLGQATQTLVAYADGTANQFIAIWVNDTTFNGSWEGNASSGAATFSLYPHSVGTPGVTSWYNIVFLERTGSTLRLTVNADAPTTGTISNPSNNCAASRMSLGSLDRTAGNSEIWPLVGGVSHVLSVVGRTFTTQEKADLYDHLFQAGEFRGIV